MFKTELTVGLFDKDTEKQEIATETAIEIIADALINKHGLYAFTMIKCEGVYKMESTGSIVREPSIRIEIATEEILEYIPVADSLKELLNQESIMVEFKAANIDFI